MRTSSTLSRGIVAGVIGASVLALWFLGVDLVRGEAFQTPLLVAGSLTGMSDAQATVPLLAFYTLIHFVAFMVVGVLVAMLFGRAGVTPHWGLGLPLGFLLFDLVFYTSVAVTGVNVVEALGWPQVLIGNLLAGAALLGYLQARSSGAPYSLRAAVRENRVVREALVAGLLGAAAVMVWFFIFDLVRGQPFFTPAALASALFTGARSTAEVSVTAAMIIGYTTLHVAAFLVVGLVAAALAVAAEREPSVLLGLALLFVTTEALFIGMLAIAASWLVGALSWWGILGANVLATVVMGAYLWRVHPRLHRRIEAADLEEDLVHAGEV